MHDNGAGGVKSLQHSERTAITAMSDTLKELAQRLLASLEEGPRGEIEAAWDRELEERVSAYERGELKMIPAEDVFAEARRLAR